MAVALAQTALQHADEFRHGRTTCRPIDLWREADGEAGVVAGDDDTSRQILRTERFRHAMIHAGYLLTGRGSPYKRCPMCHTALRR